MCPWLTHSIAWCSLQKKQLLPTRMEAPPKKNKKFEDPHFQQKMHGLPFRSGVHPANRHTQTTKADFLSTLGGLSWTGTRDFLGAHFWTSPADPMCVDCVVSVRGLARPSFPVFIPPPRSPFCLPGSPFPLGPFSPPLAQPLPFMMIPGHPFLPFLSLGVFHFEKSSI